MDSLEAYSESPVVGGEWNNGSATVQIVCYKNESPEATCNIKIKTKLIPAAVLIFIGILKIYFILLKL